MKKTLSKKVSCLCMAAMLAISLAVPTFAAEPRASGGDSLTSAANTSYQLNCNVASYPVDGTKLTVYHNTNHGSQRWVRQTFPGTALWYFTNSANRDVTLSYNGGAQAVVASKSYYAQDTQAIKVVTESTSTQGYSDLGLVLPSRVLALTATSLSDNAQVQWQSPNGQKNQLWLLGMYPTA